MHQFHTSADLDKTEEKNYILTPYTVVRINVLKNYIALLIDSTLGKLVDREFSSGIFDILI